MGRGKDKRKKKLKDRRIRRIKQGKLVPFVLIKSGRKFDGIHNKFMYKAIMHQIIYKDGFLNNVRFLSSNITKCNFRKAKFLGVEFIHTNLKGSSFKAANFHDIIFFNANLKDVDFADVKFNNVVFINCNLKNSKNLNLKCEGINVINCYPKLSKESDLKSIVKGLAIFPQVYKFHILHINKHKINNWNLSLLLKEYSSEQIKKGLLSWAKRKNKKPFYTFYSIKNYLKSYFKT